MSNLYVTTQGPVPWTARVSAGKVYEATQRAVGLRYQIVDDAGLSMAICIPRCSLDGCHNWTFCDQHGNPVPAPWESECSECGGNGAGGEHEEDCRMIPNIDYRAHAESLAEAGKLMRDRLGLKFGTAAAEFNAALTPSPQSDQEEA